jgi:hypothetical protein
MTIKVSKYISGLPARVRVPLDAKVKSCLRGKEGTAVHWVPPNYYVVQIDDYPKEVLLNGDTGEVEPIVEGKQS